MRLIRWIRQHLGLVAELAGYGFWLLIDLIAAVSTDGPLTLVAALLVPGIVLLRRWPGASLMRVASLAISMSLAISLLTSTLVSGTLTPAYISFAEQLALAVLVVTVLHRCELRPALVLTGAAALAVVCSPSLRMPYADGTTFALISALGWGGAVAIGTCRPSSAPATASRSPHGRGSTAWCADQGYRDGAAVALREEDGQRPRPSAGLSQARSVPR
jgi:hypothetical protein